MHEELTILVALAGAATTGALAERSRWKRGAQRHTAAWLAVATFGVVVSAAAELAPFVPVARPLGWTGSLLVVCGFIGTLVAAERARSQRRAGSTPP